ncbi:MAG TPA: prolipoprotein diacylglyceryl transferase [Candidatus Acidoferrales bacterium]|nr:prolipoprotein diacylglyceryl transferase [Candidatus Acidoferrales bacterium]
MVPFLHVWRLTIPTFGLMVASAMIIAYFVLRADLARRGIAAIDSGFAEALIAIPSLSGIAGAKLYHVLEDPSFLIAHLSELVSQFGFAWFGGLIAGVVAFVLVGRRRKVPLLRILDAGSAAAALGYGVGRIGCLLSGDGDYGKPTSLPWGMSFPHGLVPTTQRVHPTPIYELIVACLIAWALWKLGERQIRTRISSKAQRLHSVQPLSPSGFVFAAYLILTGIARFLVEFIRINPRSFFGLTNAQAASLVSIAAGAILWIYLSKSRQRSVVALDQSVQRNRAEREPAKR